MSRCPEIYIPPEKEIRYFETRWRFQGLSQYQDRFAAGEGRLKGELTPSYALLPSPVIKAVQELNPRMKLIFLARRPAERAWSHARHCYCYFESTFRNRKAPLNQLPEADLVTHFLSDYALTSADYLGTLRRWLRFFPVEQFHVRYFEEVFADPREYLHGLLKFLGIEREPTASDELTARINEGLNVPLPEWAGSFLENLFQYRQREMEIFLEENFGLRSVWKAPVTTPDKCLWLEDQAPAWRVSLRDGLFQAANLENGTCLKSRFLGDIRMQIARAKGTLEAIPGVPNDEDRLLAGVLAEQDYDFDHDQAEEQGSFRGFSTFHWKNQFWGIRQTLGPFNGEAILRSHYAPEDVVVAGSRSELESRIDTLETRSILENLARHAASDAPQSPQNVAQHRGFNILRFKDCVYGLRQSLGEVDLSLGEEVLVARYADQDLVRGTSVDGIKAQIDFIEVSGKLRQLEQNVSSLAEAIAVTNRAPTWFQEFRSFVNQQVADSSERAVNEASRAARNYTTEAVTNLRVELSRELAKVAEELTHERQYMQSLVRIVEQQTAQLQRQTAEASARDEHLLLKINQISEALGATTQQLSRVETDLKNVCQSRIWRTLARIGGVLNAVLGNGSRSRLG